MTATKWLVSQEVMPWNQPNGKWFAVPHNDTRNDGQYFHTHAEALAYADRMARTVEVVLPRVKRVRHITTSYRDKDGRLEAESWPDGDLLIEDMGDHHMVVIPPEWGEEVALTLLALAKGQQ